LPERDLRDPRPDPEASGASIPPTRRTGELNTESGRVPMRYNDWDFGFGFGQRYAAHPRRGGSYGYDRGYAPDGYDQQYRGPRGSEAVRRRTIGEETRATSYGGSGYGGPHPSFGGTPGGQEEGMYYGGSGRGEGSGWTPDPAGYGWRRGGAPASRAEWSRRRVQRGFRSASYDRPSFSGGSGEEDTFLPDTAYRRYPGLSERPGQNAHRAGPGQPFREWGDSQDDETILQAVRESLFQDRYVDGDALEVQVNDAVVTLRGEVDDFLEARYAWDDAWEVEGVRGVLNQITVRTDRS
jgi:hypothetical protein